MTDNKECALCGKVLGAFGILLGAVLLLISVDVLTDGGITGLLTGKVSEDDE